VTTLTQALVMTLVGTVILRLVHADAHLYYVRPWMMWPLVASAAVLLVFSVVVALRSRTEGEAEHPPGGVADVVEHQPHADHDGGAHQAPMTAWLLLLPVLLVFLVNPSPLGAYVAERRPNEVPEVSDAGFVPLPDQQVVDLSINEFLTRALYDDSRSLEGRDVALTGFVSHDKSGHWYVTRLSLGCCAADATSLRVRVESPSRPPRDTWVRVTGTWKAPEDMTKSRADDAAMVADLVEPADEPKNPYE
jgi:uncharacterized repeat protein (TIGR03943 family)